MFEESTKYCAVSSGKEAALASMILCTSPPRILFNSVIAAIITERVSIYDDHLFPSLVSRPELVVVKIKFKYIK